MVVFVVGLYKSGTSYITSLIESLGMPTVVDRIATTKGVHRTYDIRESYRVNMLNNSIFEYYKSNITYFNTKEFSESLPQEYRERIKQIYEDYNYNCVIKDPRLIALLPFWIEALDGEDYKIVWVKRRNVEDTINSFKSDKWFDDKLTAPVENTVDSLNMNLDNAIDSLNTGILIEYEDAVENERATLIRLFNFLQDYNTEYIPEGFFTEQDKKTYQYLVRSYFKSNTSFAELGVWKGRSLTYVMETLIRKKANIFAVDNFNPPKTTRISSEAKEKNIEEEFLKNMAEFDYDKRINFIKQDSAEAANSVKDETFSMIFIDSYHDYEHCKKEIKNWLPKIISGGLIAGHDYKTFDSIRMAVDEMSQGKQHNIENIWFFKKEL